MLWGHFLHAYFEMFARDLDRPAEVRERVNLMPIGAGALAAQRLIMIAQRWLANWVLTDSPSTLMDVSADRDFVIDTLLPRRC